MAIPGPSTPQPSLSWRQVQSHLRNVVLSQPIRDVDSLLDVLLPTLHIMDIVPSPPAVPLDVAQRHTPQRVFGKLIHGRPLEEDAPLGGGEEREDEEAWLRAFRSQAWLGDVQRSLLVGSIAETWDHEMKEREPEIGEAIRRAWFVPQAAVEQDKAASASSSSKMIVMEGSEDEDRARPARRLQSAAAMTLSGLQALSPALSTLASRTAGSSTTASSGSHRATSPLLSSTLQVAHWYAAAPDLLGLLLEGARMQGNAAKRSLVWGEVVKILASLQDRVANAAADDEGVDVVGFAKKWGKGLLSQLVGGLLAAEGDKADLPLLADLFTKLLRTNPQLLTAASSANGDSICFWPPLLRQLISLSPAPGLQLPPQVLKRWHLSLSHLDSRDRQNVDLSLAHFLHRRFLQIEVIDAAKERGRPAAVGKAFLSGETAQRVEVGARVLGMLWGSMTAAGASTNPKQDGPESSDEDDDDDEDDHFTHLLTRIILPSHRSSSALLWSAGTARAFVCYVAGASSPSSSAATQRLQDVVTRAVEQWGNLDRVRRTTTQEEHYFIAMILGVLAELSNSAHPSQPGLATSRSPSFIQGVGSHLEHPDPALRRMGMLLAEVVSEVAHREQQAAGEAKEGKPLSFGSSMWDGVGEGREEARVLRALWHGWGMMRDRGRRDVEGMRGERVLEMLGLKEQKEALVQQESAVATSKSASRQAPRTRQLPQRVPARRDGQGQDAEPQPKAGGRSLIVELDEDEGAAAGSSLRLNQVTSRGSKPRPLVSVESDNDDSSSESGSSSDDDQDHEPPSIDADLLPGDASQLPDPKKKKPSTQRDADPQDELLGLGVDKKKRRPPPVYISDLTAMLRDHKERDSIRLALKHGEELLRRKGQLAPAAASTSASSTALAFSTLSIGTGSSGSRGPRGEIDEHNIDLLLQLCALQNNYRIHSFEPRRRAMLRCLIIWAPRIAVPALVEQIFAPNYSITQRLGMLEALGWGARELCGCGAGKGEGMRGWTDEAIGRARKEGEERVPEVKRERDLQRLTDVGAGGERTRMLRRPQQEGGRAGIQEIATSTTGQSTVQRLPSQYAQSSAMVRSAPTTPPLSSSLFIFPLLTRLRSHLSDASSRLSRARQISTFTHNSTNPSSLGLATPDLFTASPPLLLPAILDTLALLTATYVQEQRPTPLDAHGVVLPEMLEVATHVIREGLPLLAFVAKDADGKQGGSKDEAEGGGSGNVVAAISSLILVTLDLALESPSAEASRLPVATERGAAALDDALRFASGVFENEDAKSGTGGGKGVGMGISRTGRICAAIVVRIEELRERERERWLGELGSR